MSIIQIVCLLWVSGGPPCVYVDGSGLVSVDRGLLAFSSLRLLLVKVANILFVVRVLCCLVACSHPLHTTATGDARHIATSGSTRPISIVICTRNRPRSLHGGLPMLLGRSCPSCRVVIIGSNSSTGDRSILGLFSGRCGGLCCACIPMSARCLDRGGLTLAVKVGTTQRSVLLFARTSYHPVNPG